MMAEPLNLQLKIKNSDITHRFRILNEVPLNKSNLEVQVNFIEYWGYLKKKDKVTYHNTWITDFTLTRENAYIIMRGGWVASVPAYNLSVWMMWLNNKNRFNEEPDTIRMCLINVPARLITRSRQWIVRLSKNYVYRERWQHPEKSIMQLNFA